MAKTTYTYDELIEICEAAIVPEDRWHNRDSCDAQAGVGRSWAFLKAGVPYEILTGADGLATDERTIWIEFSPAGFRHFEDGPRDSETEYLPTLERLQRANGGDWY